MALVKVFEHKKVKINDEVKDMLKIVYVTYADIKNDIAILDVPKDKKVKNISRLMSDIENEDYIYEEVNIDFIKFGNDSLTEEEVLEKAKNLLMGMYYEIIQKDGIFICMKEIFDDKIRKEYDINVVPSLNKQMSFLFENMSESGSITLDDDITNQLLGKNNSLELQDSNVNKSVVSSNIKEIYSGLKEIVFGQDEQLKIILANILKNVSISYSELDVEMIKRLKNNILLIGPTGTGKTLMVESLANLLDVPYIICDAKRYTCNGYTGEDVESILVDLYHKCNEDMDKFEHGIIFIDEFDKLCEVKDERSHVNTTDVQESILKLLDGTVINKKIGNVLSEKYLSFDTSKITFVLSGAFTKMFETENEITEKTLEKYGMLSELVGRIGSKVILNSPSKEDLKNALINSKYSYLKMFNMYLGMINVDYEINDEFIDYIVDLAYEMKLGYRGLEKVICDYVDQYLFDLISGDNRKLVYQRKQ